MRGLAAGRQRSVQHDRAPAGGQARVFSAALALFLRKQRTGKQAQGCRKLARHILFASWPASRGWKRPELGEAKSGAPAEVRSVQVPWYYVTVTDVDLHVESNSHLSSKHLSQSKIMEAF